MVLRSLALALMLQEIEERFKGLPAQDAKFDTFGTYGTSKLAATLLHLELARRVQAESAVGSQVYINVASPGMVR